jgi:hypothetical protein
MLPGKRAETDTETGACEVPIAVRGVVYGE